MYVASRLEWYQGLYRVAKTNGRSQRENIETQLVEAALQNDHQVSDAKRRILLSKLSLATFYDAFKANGWEAAITAIKIQEENLRNDVRDYDAKQTRRHTSDAEKSLHEIEELTKSLQDQVKRYLLHMASGMSRLVELEEAEAIKEKKEEGAERDKYIAAFCCTVHVTRIMPTRTS